MSKKSQTLEEFVENYIQNKLKSNGQGYTGWVVSNGINSGKVYSDSVREASRGYRIENGDYGTRAEGLYGLGLSESGYSDYVKENAFSDMQSGLAEAKESFDSNEQKNMQGYVKALEAEKKKFTSLVKSIESARILDYNDAYRYAVSSGLSDEDAKMVAKTGSDIVRKKIKNEVMKLVVSKKLTKSQTKEYAISLGLSEKEAAELSYYAGNINEYLNSPDYEGGYLDYLKNKN